MILKNFLVGLPIILLCLAFQGWVAIWCVRHFVRHSGQSHNTGLRPLLVAMVAMMFGNFFQVIAWGLVFLWLGEFEELYEAVYHSAVNFASLGYGDIVMSKSWKMLGPLEAINGVLMLGMSAAALMAILQHMIRDQYEQYIADKAAGDGKK